MSKYTKLIVSFKAPFGLVNCLVSIKDGYVIATFKDLKPAKEFYRNEKVGGADVKLIEKNKSIIEKYEGKTKEEILEIIKTELKKVGGKYTEQKVKIK